MSILSKNKTFFKTLLNPQIVTRTLTSSTNEKPLSVLFEEAVGLKPKPNPTEEEDNNELKRKLLEIEKRITELKKTQPLKKQKGNNLYKLFKEKEKEGEGVVRVYKELSLEMVSFVKVLHKHGYLNNANFISGEKLELGCFDEEYARTFVKFASEKFGKDHQEIAKWLSGSDLKNIVLFGCPSLEKRAIFAAKTLRKFFDIPENNVCDKCVLKTKCKFPNQSVWDGKTQILHLSVVMKVITLYPLDLTHPKLQVPQEVQDSVSRLLTEIQNLSRTICTPLG